MMEILRYLTTPSRFRNNWYGYLTNQASHAMFGLFTVWLACILSFWIGGDLPYRIEIFLGIATVYAAKEVFLDKWNGWDTIEDFAFVVVYGAGGTIAAFKQIDEFEADVIFSMTSSAPFMIAFATHLTTRTIYIWWTSKRNERTD